MKALLLNQQFLRGIGNIYADEALFRGGDTSAGYRGTPAAGTDKETACGDS